eukprot:scpid47743/ scgid4485/ Probable receptor protein kinase TMK1
MSLHTVTGPHIINCWKRLIGDVCFEPGQGSGHRHPKLDRHVHREQFAQTAQTAQNIGQTQQAKITASGPRKQVEEHPAAEGNGSSGCTGSWPGAVTSPHPETGDGYSGMAEQDGCSASDTDVYLTEQASASLSEYPEHPYESEVSSAEDQHGLEMGPTRVDLRGSCSPAENGSMQSLRDLTNQRKERLWQKARPAATYAGSVKSDTLIMPPLPATGSIAHQPHVATGAAASYSVAENQHSADVTRHQSMVGSSNGQPAHGMAMSSVTYTAPRVNASSVHATESAWHATGSSHQTVTSSQGKIPDLDKLVFPPIPHPMMNSVNAGMPPGDDPAPSTPPCRDLTPTKLPGHDPKPSEPPQPTAPDRNRFSTVPDEREREPSPIGAQQMTSWPYADLYKLTKGFDSKNSEFVLGQGGFGTVYKVYLHGHHCAVKRLCLQASGDMPLQGFQSMSEFARELETLMVIRCSYLVMLMGYCEDGPEPCLVYEYMENGSLAAWLFEMHEPRQIYGPLTGAERLDIASDTAKALRYLHNMPRDPVIHCNVKSSNILIGEHKNAKLADFGHVRHLSSSPQGRTALSTRSKYSQVASTYMDPDVFLIRKLDPKVDIYGFGVVLLEMITGRKAFDEAHPHSDLILETEEILSDRNMNVQCQERFLSMCDEFIQRDLIVEELLEFGDLTSSCLDDRMARPDSKDVDGKLNELRDMVKLRYLQLDM